MKLKFVKSFSVEEVLILLKKLASSYSARVLEMGVTGQDLVICNEFDLNLMGFNYRPHRLRMIKFLDKLQGRNKLRI